MIRPSPFDPQEMARCWELYFEVLRRKREETEAEFDWRKANADAQADYNTEKREGWSNGE